jgi:hypothetical protein
MKIGDRLHRESIFIGRYCNAPYLKNCRTGVPRFHEGKPTCLGRGGFIRPGYFIISLTGSTIQIPIRYTIYAKMRDTIHDIRDTNSVLRFSLYTIY